MNIATVTTGLGLMSLKDMMKPLPPGFKSGVDPSLLVKTKPSPTNQQGNHLQMFKEWRSDLLKKLDDKKFPNFKEEKSYNESICSILNADEKKSEAIKLRDDISKKQPVNQDSLNKANQVVAEAATELQNKIREGKAVAKLILERVDISSDSFDDSDLITCSVLTEATPEKLAKWCDQCPHQAKQLLAFLHDTDTMRMFLTSGGAKNGEYPRAVEIFHQIKVDSTNPVLQRLALAVALELCAPLPRFDRTNEFVNPLQRYIHYEQAYLLGELDAAFSRFNVWEMRQIVNSDATEEELAWGRQSLVNYRPDLANTDNPQWKYCMIVKTDVGYANPDWYKKPKSFDQILSGGGKCGPRAWYGRMICKAFGIPTWGVRQPGHAAMTRWTINGWCTCLGAGFQYSNWEGECGLNFELTTQAMRACGSEDAFMKKVRRLEWIAVVRNEDSKSVKGSFLPSIKSPWYSLSFFQRKLLAPGASAANAFMYPQIDVTPNIYVKLKNRSVDKGSIELQPNGTVLIPAEDCSSPKAGTNKVLFFRSYLGGQQLFLKENGTVEYTLQGKFLNAVPTKYLLSCLVCTAHRKSTSLSLVVCVDGKLSLPISINLPYTTCMWGETKPVTIEIGGPNVKCVILRFVRENQPFGFGLKRITLTKV